MDEKEINTQNAEAQQVDEFKDLTCDQLIELVKALREENQKVILELKKAEQYKEDWLRARADFENFKKRNNETRRNAYEDGKNDVIKSILCVGDNLDRALLAVKDEQTKKGLEMVTRQFGEIMNSIGVTEINPIGEKFDPNVAEAVMQAEPEEGEQSEMVKQVFLKGYRSGDKIIRFAQVIVTK